MEFRSRRQMIALLLPLLAALLGRTVAQSEPVNPLSASNSGQSGTSNGTFGTPALCLANAGSPNMTGQQTIAPDIQQGGQGGSVKFKPVSWRTTVYQPSGNNASRTELSLWFDTNGVNYTDNNALGFDACYFWMLQWNLNTYFRAQSDPGDCSAAMNQACIGDLQNAANDAARLLVSNPTTGPNSNLTANSLPDVCTKIAAMVGQQFPQSCAPFFNGTGRLASGGTANLGGALTGPKSLVSASQCKNQYGSLMWTQVGDATKEVYTLSSWWVTGFMTVFFPIANAERLTYLGAPATVVTCLRASNVSSDSVVPMAAPAPSPLQTSSSDVSSNSTTNSTTNATTSNISSISNTRVLAGGAIAGIAVAGVIGLAIVVAAIAFLFYRRRRTLHPDAGSGTARAGSTEMEGRSALLHPGKPEAPDMNTYYEMSSQRNPAELHNKSVDPIELPVNEHFEPPEYEMVQPGQLGRTHYAAGR